MVNLRENSGALAIAFVGIMLLSTFALGFMSKQGLISLSPISTYQGIHPSFQAVYYDGQYYTTGDPGEATTSRIGPATMNFDPDGPVVGQANLGGELRDIQIVRNLAYYQPGDAYQHIVADFGGSPQPEGPYRVYEWEVEEGDSKHIYRMELWLCSLQINLWVQPDARPWWALFREYEIDSRYSDTEVWLKLEASNYCGHYFEGVDLENVYFGIGYMELAELIKSDDPRLQVIPASKWTALDLYDNIGGSPDTVASPDSVAYGYEGATLNQAVFKKEWYTKLTLQSFGTYDVNLLDYSFKSDTAQWKILVHVFVVGDWVVKPEDERDTDPHDPPWYTGPLQGLFEAMGKFFDDPLWRVKLAVIVSILVLVVLLMYFPGSIIRVKRGYDKVREEWRAQ